MAIYVFYYKKNRIYLILERVLVCIFIASIISCNGLGSRMLKNMDDKTKRRGAYMNSSIKTKTTPSEYGRFNRFSNKENSLIGGYIPKGYHFE